MLPFRHRISPKALAIGIFSIVLIWFISGIIFPSAKKEIQTEQTATTLPSVQVTHFRAEPKTTSVTLYGMTQASRRLDMKAEVQGKVVEIQAKEGAGVKKDDIILRIEPRDLSARLSEATALVKQRQIEYDAALKLGAKGFSAENRLAETDASLQQAKAQLIRARLDMDNTAIRAPFDGWLEKINVEVGDLIGPGILVGQGTFNDGSNTVTLIDRDPMLVIGQVAERHRADIRPGSTATVRFPGGTEASGTVSYIGGVADALTRTFRVELEVPNPEGAIASGITASLIIPVKEEPAHHIPSSLLVLNDAGDVGIMAVEGGKATFHGIEIGDSDAEGLWVTGLPAELDIITQGQSFVADGTEVQVKEAK